MWSKYRHIPGLTFLESGFVQAVLSCRFGQLAVGIKFLQNFISGIQEYRNKVEMKIHKKTTWLQNNSRKERQENYPTSDVLAPERHILNLLCFSCFVIVSVPQVWLYSYKCDVVCKFYSLLQLISVSLNSPLKIDCAKRTTGTCKNHRYFRKSQSRREYRGFAVGVP